MVGEWIKRFGPTRGALAITTLSICASVCLYLACSWTFVGFTLRGLLTSALIPAWVAPGVSFLFLRLMVQLLHSEEGFRKSEKKYRLILEGMEEGYFETDLAGNFLFFNDSICRILGYERSEIEGRNYREFVPPETLPSMEKTFRHIHRTGKAARLLNYDVIRRDGKKRTIEISVSLISDSLDRALGFRGIARDITERKCAEQALKDSERRYRSVFENTGTATVIIEKDTTISMANTEFEKLSGYSKSEVEGKKSWTEFVVKDDLEQMKKYHRERRKTGAEAPTEYEFGFVDRHGNFTYVLNRVTVIPGTDKSVASLMDITSRKRAEDALKESEEKYKKLYDESKRAEELYRSLLHSSADAIVMYDLEGRARYVSPAFTEIFGWTMEEVKGKRIPFLPESEHQRTMEGIRRILDAGEAIQGFETKRYTKDGRVIEVSVSGSRYDDHEGKAAGMLVILRDISEKKKLEAQLQQAQKMEAIGTLAGGIAHDFNNLLMAIQGNVSLMLYEMAEGDRFYGRLRSIEQQVQSGAKLTSQLLGYARKGKYEVRLLDLNGLVGEISEAFGRTRKDITIERELAEGLYGLEGDRGQIEQVLLNLFVNAADAMVGGGELRLKTANVGHEEMAGKLYRPKAGCYVMLEVSDNGVGMDKEVQEKIFDPFFTTKEMGRGTGLGLASVYGIVKGHGGYIDVESRKGEGSCFRIYLPATEREVGLGGVKAVGGVVQGSGTILLVDDEQMVLEVGAKMLEALGYRVLEAKGGEEAVALYEKRKGEIDLVILDMVMPKMGGGEVYDRIKEMDPQAKVLLCSGYSIEGQAGEILKRGCNGFIQKPFSVKELSGRVHEVLLN